MESFVQGARARSIWYMLTGATVGLLVYAAALFCLAFLVSISYYAWTETFNGIRFLVSGFRGSKKKKKKERAANARKRRKEKKERKMKREIFKDREVELRPGASTESAAV